MSGEMEVVYGVIGGSGLYEFVGPDREEDVEPVLVRERRFIKTPFGYPSSDVVRRIIDGKKVFFLARHGYGHALNPSEVPYRANIYILKRLGVNRLIAISAVGSLQEDIHPGMIVVPDQVIDLTKGIRPSTFLEKGIVGHVSMAEPYCSDLRQRLAAVGTVVCSTELQTQATLVCMEGPQFSTRAESNLYRSWGAHLIGMTIMPEAKLAREAGICYATLAPATDYDCWHEGHGAVTVEMVTEQMKKNSVVVTAILSEFFTRVHPPMECNCSQAMARAFATDPDTLPPYTHALGRFDEACTRVEVVCGDHLPKLKEE